MPFHDILERYKGFDFAAATIPERVASVLDRDRLSERDYLALLSDAADPFLELLARKANNLTRRHFGDVVFIFTPLYISNYCDNACPYCSFGRNHSIERRHLSLENIEAEALRIAGSGIRHILVLTGESRAKAPPGYLEAALRILRRHFSSISIEVYPLTEDEYGGLVECGADGLTIYQETYNEERYHELHKGGPKDNFAFRLEAPERACRQGIRTVAVGALLGLHDPKIDAFFAGLHAAYLLQAFPSVEVSLSFPRLRPLVSSFKPECRVSDRLLARMIVASRLFLPAAGITLSTRESAGFRDAALPLGVTRMSAGVSTAVGGRSGAPSTPQFEIADTRSVEMVQSDLLQLGYQPVMHDWNTGYVR